MTIAGTIFHGRMVLWFILGAGNSRVKTQRNTYKEAMSFFKTGNSNGFHAETQKWLSAQTILNICTIL